MNHQVTNKQLLLTMNFHDNTMMLNEEILDAMGRPRQVQILLNDESKRLLLRPCEVDSNQAVVIPAEHVLQVEIGAKQLLRKIRKLAGWETEQPRICAGEPVEEYHAAYFDLARAIAVTPETAVAPA